MDTWLIVVPMVGAAAIVGALTIAVILLTGPNDEDDSARPVPTLSQPAVSEPETHILNVAKAEGGGLVLQLRDPRGDVPCLAPAI